MGRSTPVVLSAFLLMSISASLALGKGRQPEAAPYEPIRFEEFPTMPETSEPKGGMPGIPSPEPEAMPSAPSISASDLKESEFKPAEAPEPVAPEPLAETPAIIEEPATPEPPAALAEEPPPAPVKPAVPAVVKKAPARPPVQSHYKVWIWQENGDTLARIARKVYGDPTKWKIIYLANRDVIKDPNRIFPKQKLKIPPADWTPE